LSDQGGAVSRAYGMYNENEKAPRRVTYLISESGRVVSMQIDEQALDPTAIIKACAGGAKE
jgi:peroxiredoxin